MFSLIQTISIKPIYLLLLAIIDSFLFKFLLILQCFVPPVIPVNCNCFLILFLVKLAVNLHKNQYLTSLNINHVTILFKFVTYSHNSLSNFWVQYGKKI